MKSLTAILHENDGLLDNIAVHPSTNFPGRMHENVLLALLRKKPEPAVEERLEQGRERAAKVGGADEWASQHEYWRWARSLWEGRVATYLNEENGANYTVEEVGKGIESVRTGLRKALPEWGGLDDGDESENEDGMDIDGGGGGGDVQEQPKPKQLPPQPQPRKVDVEFGLRAAVTGGLVLNPRIELESKRHIVVHAIRKVDNSSEAAPQSQ
jgi:mediator of RNA polymerase II transcription subunit 8, fungi type